MRRTGLHRLAWIGFALALVWLTAPLSLGAQDGQESATSPPSEAEATQHFEEAVAPVIAQHCLECHDTATKEGGLDLSRKASAFAGGDSGQAIVAGKSADSLLWQYVETDDMPRDRPPLGPEQKEALRKWIDAGAAWSGEVIDPAAHKRAGRRAYNSVRRLTVPEYIGRCARRWA